MKSIQDHFNASFEKDVAFIKGEELTEKFEGSSLVVKDYPELETLDVEKWEQIKNITFENCPKLKSIKVANKHQEPIVIVPPKETDWLCIIGLTSGLLAILLHIYKWYKARNRKEKK